MFQSTEAADLTICTLNIIYRLYRHPSRLEHSNQSLTQQVIYKLIRDLSRLKPPISKIGYIRTRDYASIVDRIVILPWELAFRSTGIAKFDRWPVSWSGIEELANFGRTYSTSAITVTNNMHSIGSTSISVD